uniref:Uncharacterized protein n=1 Tax=Nonomuraea gerenzanensis TaxID=93944 RepID=A0A1M4EB28_9ACTN|nr:hypothetical protein BN4615_P5621 [Nonomuraea gerenzanensis]
MRAARPANWRPLRGIPWVGRALWGPAPRARPARLRRLHLRAGRRSRGLDSRPQARGT